MGAHKLTRQTPFSSNGVFSFHTIITRMSSPLSKLAAARVNLGKNASLPLPTVLLFAGGLVVVCLCLAVTAAVVGYTTLSPHATLTLTRAPAATASQTRLPPSREPSLTPFSLQVYNMTRDATLQLSPFAPFIFKSETPTPIAVLTQTQAAQLTLAATHTNAVCLLAYPDFCIPPGVRKTCDQLGQSNFTVLPPDPFHYDPDGNGKGCE